MSPFVEAPPPAPRRLGVLFVHGIGVQRRGETLADFGQPILQWLQDWRDGLRDRWVGARVAAADLQKLGSALELAGSSNADPGATAWALDAIQDLLDDVKELPRETTRNLRQAAKELEQCVLAAGVELVDARRETVEDPQAPAHAELVLRRLLVDGSIAEERWLIAESWWAETFWAPRFSELALWGLGIVPWTIGSHYGAAVRRIWGERTASQGRRRWWTPRLAASVLRLFASLPLALVALTALALLLPAALLPVPWLRGAIAAAQRQIAASLGDSYVLVTRPIEAASIVGQVRRDLAWLEGAVAGGELAIVAHSQGAAVTHEALRRGLPGGLRLLFTFGSGLRKLEELRQLLGRSGHFAARHRADARGPAPWRVLRLAAVALVGRRGNRRRDESPRPVGDARTHLRGADVGAVRRRRPGAGGSRVVGLGRGRGRRRSAAARAAFRRFRRALGGLLRVLVAVGLAAYLRGRRRSAKSATTAPRTPGRTPPAPPSS